MVSLSLDFYHHPQIFSEEVVTLTPCIPKGRSQRQPSWHLCPVTAPLSNQRGPTMGHCPETRFSPSRHPALRAAGLPTCLGLSGHHRSLCSWPCTSGTVPAGPGRKALWENATGWSSQLSGAPAECCAVWEERKSFLTSQKCQVSQTAQQKDNQDEFENASWFSNTAHTSHEPSSQRKYIQ